MSFMASFRALVDNRMHGPKERRQMQNTALQNEGDVKRTKKMLGEKLEEKKEQRKNSNMLNGKKKKEETWTNQQQKGKREEEKKGL